MVEAVPKVEDGFLAERLAFVLAGDLVLVVLEVALLAEVGFLCEAVVRGHNV